jgi:2-C-methyl-D-erythritol 4-phosphate cytidylyltransferase
LHALPEAVASNVIVLVHDAARPNLHADDISRLIAAALAHADGAILAAPVRDTLKRIDDIGGIERTEPRNGMWRALTPQAFRRDLLLHALEAARADGVAVTDDAQAVERLGLHPRLVEGREDNLKVTTPVDLALAEFLLARTP